MKVVISTYTFLPEIGGVATNVSNLAAAFNKLGYDTTVVTLSSGDPTTFPYRVIRNPSPLELMRQYREADLLILSNLSLRLAYPLLLLRRPIALRHHSESAFELTDKIFSGDRLRKMILPLATHFMTSAYIGEKGPYRPYTVTPPFASIDQFTNDIRLPIGARQDAVFVGRLEPEKGVEWLLTRWPKFREKLGVEKLHVVGEGSSGPRLRQSYLDSSGIVFHGAQSRQQTAKIFGACRYSFVPSLWAEPFGAVALEALAAETIPIVSNRGGLPETVPGFGHYFDPSSEESATAAVKSAKTDFDRQLANLSERQAWLAKAQIHLAHFEPTNVAKKIIAVMQPRNC